MVAGLLLLLLALGVPASDVDLQQVWGTPVLHSRGNAAEPWRECVRRAVQQLRRMGGSVGRSNRGGWQSADNLLNFALDRSIISLEAGQRAKYAESGLSACFQLLKLEIYSIVSAFVEAELRHRLSQPPSTSWSVVLDGCWANVHDAPSSWNVPHTHPNTHISGVLYLAAGGGGPLHLHSPLASSAAASRCNAALTDRRVAEQSSDALAQEATCRIAPISGDSLVFPAWLKHHVASEGEANASTARGPRISIAFNAMVVPSASPPSPGEERFGGDDLKRARGSSVRAHTRRTMHWLWPSTFAATRIVSERASLRSGSAWCGGMPPLLFHRPLSRRCWRWEQLVLEKASRALRRNDARTNSTRTCALPLPHLMSLRHFAVRRTALLRPKGGGRPPAGASTPEPALLHGVFIIEAAAGAAIRLDDPRPAADLVPSTHYPIPGVVGADGSPGTGPIDPLGLEASRRLRVVAEETGLLLLFSPWVPFYVEPVGPKTARLLLEFDVVAA